MLELAICWFLACISVYEKISKGKLKSGDIHDSVGIMVVWLPIGGRSLNLYEYVWLF